MEPALWISKSGLEAQDMHIATIANNLANVNTTGYKKGRAIFEDLIYQNQKQAGAQSSQNSQIPTGINMGTGVHMVATEKIFSQGGMQNTQNALDLAIQGRGFLTVLMPDGSQAYTRDGSLKTDSTGQLVTSNGYPIQPAVTIPAQVKNITIGRDGTVSATVYGNTTPQIIGNIQLSDFINEGGLQPIGENLYVETAASGNPVSDTPGKSGLGNVLQGFRGIKR
jgi:flagellar basal-body rod protein FlgG